MDNFHVIKRKEGLIDVSRTNIVRLDRQPKNQLYVDDL